MSLTTQEPRDLKAPERMPAAPAESMLALLARAADPASGIDIERMKEIRALYKEIKADEAEREFAAAMAQMQGELPLVAQGGRDTHKNISYSRLEDVLAAARPAMQRHGFSIGFDIVHEKDGVVVTGTLTHSAGHSRSTTRRYPIDTGPGRSAIQALGSSETYGRRYVMMSLLNIASDKDDDGHAAMNSKSEGEKLSQGQVDQLRDLLQSTNSNEKQFLNFVRFPSLDVIPAAKFDDMVRTINRKTEGRR